MLPSQGARTSDDRGTQSRFDKPKIVGKIASNDVTESSGIAASKCQPDVFWTHNDSGDDAFIFAINEKGDDLGTWRVQNAQNDDWEDIAEFKDASGHCFIYIGDIGDNGKKRPEHTVYRVKEPNVSAADAGSNRKNPHMTDPAEMMKFSYPDKNYNAETLMVHPSTGDIYVLTKVVDGPSSVYKIKPAFGSASTTAAEKIGEVAVPNVPNGHLTGGDIAPDARHVVVCDYSAAYELTLPEKTGNFDEIWKQKPVTIDLGELDQGEAVGYTADGNSIIATSEKKHSPVVKVPKRE
jgi:hypothetical protein